MSQNARPPAVRFEKFGLAFVGRGKPQVILRDCTFEVPEGGFYLLRGRSGGGKSTLLNLLTGLFDSRDTGPRVTGRCQVLGENIDTRFPRTLRNRVAAVLQDEGLLDDLTPRENVELALRVAGRSQKLAVALLSQAGIPEPPDEVAALSGGMRKRTGVARGLAADPELFVFDEPTAGLDAPSARNLAELLLETHRQAGAKRTTIVITHDMPAFDGIPSGVIEIDSVAKRLLLKDPGDPELRVDPNAGAQPSALDSDLRPPRDPVLELIRQGVGELGDMTRTLGQSLLHLPPMFPKLCLQSIARCTVESAFFVGIGTLMLGFLATFFALRNSPLQGAFEDQILVGVGKVLVSVLTPLMVGFFFTARMAAGAAARLGTMKRTNQVAALTLMGIRPVDYLLTPLTIGFCVAMPVITFGAVGLSALSSAFSASMVSGITLVRWTESFFSGTGLVDIRFILVKTLLSGYMVSVSTYHLSMGPKRSGRDVGNSVNLGIVVGMLLVLTIHGVLTVWQFA